MHPRRVVDTAAPALLIGALALAACVGTFETPQAYDSQRYLCDDTAAWEAAVAACAEAWQADRSCGGVLSFEGELQGKPVRIESLLERTIVNLAGVAGSPDLLSAFTASGSSPYFDLALQMKSLGGEAAAAVAVDRTLQLTSSATGLADHLDDTIAEAFLRLTAGGESSDLPTVADSGTMHIDRQGSDELRATFSVAFGEAADVVHGCLHLFATEIRREQL